MNERQHVYYPMSGTFSLRDSVCCVLLTFSPLTYTLEFPQPRPKFDVLLPLETSKSVVKTRLIYSCFEKD